jgi:hypothetical protein
MENSSFDRDDFFPLPLSQWTHSHFHPLTTSTHAQRKIGRGNKKTCTSYEFPSTIILCVHK